MSKDQYSIKRVTDKDSLCDVLYKYHYLTGISKGFRTGYNYCLYKDGEIVGVIIFTGFTARLASKGMLGLDTSDNEGLFELGRLCLTPKVQSTEHNLASWFVSKAIKRLRLDTKVRVILSYADSEYHKGIVYRACNFKYYGLTDYKTDFYRLDENGNLSKQSHGKVKDVPGEWRPRTRKHRYVLIFDKTLSIRWKEVLTIKVPSCLEGMI